MDEDISVFTDTGCYLESLMKSRHFLDNNPELAAKLDVLINLELDLAIIGSEKAKSELLKASKNNITPIK